MATAAEIRENCQLTLTNGLGGAEYRVEKLPRKPGAYAKGFRLVHLHTDPVHPVYHAHQLSDGRHECSCTGWVHARECEHTQLLTAAGLFDEPVRPDDLYPPQDSDEEPWDFDEIIAINWEHDL